ncbi:hypothetical protein [Tenacibaculum xiamenense]|uniref:hypothetical protein n=1 Tax=Tenacibaculum xiamenense TaxID=1261553 RepID=UPI003894ABDC
MNKLVFRVILPISIILFGTISQWRYGLVLDGTYEFFVGFPFIQQCRGFHTSLSTQYFVMEMLLNFLAYFFITLVFCLFIRKFYRIEISKKISNSFWIGFGVFLLFFMYLSLEMQDHFLIKRNFKVKITNTGISLFNTHPDRTTQQIKILENEQQ